VEPVEWSQMRVVRTTLDLTDEAYSVAKAIAKENDTGLGRTVSELIMRSVTPARSGGPEVRLVDGLPMVDMGPMVTSEDVRAMIDEGE